MIGRRKTGLHLGMSRLYEYRGKRVTSYFTVTPDNRRINLGHNLKDARRKLLELDGEARPAGTIGDHLDELMKERKRLMERGKLSPETIDSNELELVALKKAFGNMAPEAVRPKHIWDYLHLYRGAEAPVRANREIALLSRMFSRLVNAGALDLNPCTGVERNEENARDRLVSDAEFDAFLTFCRANGHLDEDSPAKRTSDAGRRLALAAHIAYLTGKALGQVLKISRTQIKDDGIEFGKRKRGARTLVEWTTELQAAVDECLALPSKITSTYLIFSGDGQPYTATGFKSMWQRMMNAWEEAGNERFTFHDLRAKTVTDTTEAGRKASDLTGHRTEAVVSKVYDRRRIRKAPAAR